METNFVEKSNEAIKGIHDLNLDTIQEFNIDYSECFPVFVTKEINIDNKKYGMSIEINIKPIE